MKEDLYKRKGYKNSKYEYIFEEIDSDLIHEHKPTLLKKIHSGSASLFSNVIKKEPNIIHEERIMNEEAEEQQSTYSMANNRNEKPKRKGLEKFYDIARHLRNKNKSGNVFYQQIDTRSVVAQYSQGHRNLRFLDQDTEIGSVFDMSEYSYDLNMDIVEEVLDDNFSIFEEKMAPGEQNQEENENGEKKKVFEEEYMKKNIFPRCEYYQFLIDQKKNRDAIIQEISFPMNFGQKFLIKNQKIQEDYLLFLQGNPGYEYFLKKKNNPACSNVHFVDDMRFFIDYLNNQDGYECSVFFKEDDRENFEHFKGKKKPYYRTDVPHNKDLDLDIEKMDFSEFWIEKYSEKISKENLLMISKICRLEEEKTIMAKTMNIQVEKNVDLLFRLVEIFAWNINLYNYRKNINNPEPLFELLPYDFTENRIFLKDFIIKIKKEYLEIERKKKQDFYNQLAEVIKQIKNEENHFPIEISESFVEQLKTESSQPLTQKTNINPKEIINKPVESWSDYFFYLDYLYFLCVEKMIDLKNPEKLLNKSTYFFGEYIEANNNWKPNIEKEIEKMICKIEDSIDLLIKKENEKDETYLGFIRNNFVNLEKEAKDTQLKIKNTLINKEILFKRIKKNLLHIKNDYSTFKSFSFDVSSTEVLFLDILKQMHEIENNLNSTQISLEVINLNIKKIIDQLFSTSFQKIQKQLNLIKEKKEEIELFLSQQNDINFEYSEIQKGTETGKKILDLFIKKQKNIGEIKKIICTWGVKFSDFFSFYKKPSDIDFFSFLEEKTQKEKEKIGEIKKEIENINFIVQEMKNEDAKTERLIKQEKEKEKIDKPVVKKSPNQNLIRTKEEEDEIHRARLIRNLDLDVL